MTSTENQNDGWFVISVNFRDTDISFWRNGESVWQSRLSQGGVDAVIALMNHLRFAHNLLVGRYSAEHIILEIGSAAPLDPSPAIIVRGRDLISGELSQLEITSEDVRDVLDFWLHSLSGHLSAIFRTSEATGDSVPYPDRIPPELKPVLGTKPIVLAGDFGLLNGLDQFIQNSLKLTVICETGEK